MSLTVVYITNRKDCNFDWFYCSFMREFMTLGGFLPRVILVDYFKDERSEDFLSEYGTILHVNVKPNVWCGPHRLTKEPWFCASNFRNSGFCHTVTEWILFLDDLSVLVPGFGVAVREAMAANRITCGTYQKVRNLVVENGEIKSYTEFPEGMDARPPYAKDVNPFVHSGEWLFGCSVLMPTQVLVEAGGWPEFVDGMGMEDVLLGKLLHNRGHTIYFDQRMKTLESEEHHFIEKPWKRSDYGISPKDKSHAALHMVNNGMKYFVNDYCGPGGIPELRRRVLAGEPFPVVQQPRNEWFTGTLLSELETNTK